MNEEQKLIKQIVYGDEEALRRLYENTSRSVFNYIFRLVNNKEAAEDLMIETYTQIWLSAKRFKGDSNIWHLSRKLCLLRKPTVKNLPKFINYTP